MLRSVRFVVLVSVLSPIALGALAGQAPVAGPGQAQTPQRLWYPPNDPAKDIADALATAAKDGRHVLIDFGADWCPDCRVLGALFETDLVRPFAEENFHIVRVDVGRRDKNGDLVEKYGATSGEWIPAVVVIDPSGRTVAKTDTEVRITRRDTPEQLLARLRQWAPKKSIARLSSFAEHGVAVDVALERDSLGQTYLAGTFVPQTPNTHLYSTDLPADGLDGIGRPTRLSIASSERLTATGPIVANRPVLADRIELLDTTLPIYPNGPVTLRIPVRLTNAGGTRSATIVVSYMACSDKGCLPPTERTLTVTLPAL